MRDFQRPLWKDRPWAARDMTARGTGHCGLWKEGGRYICKFLANVPVAPGPTNLVFVQVAETGALMTSVGQAKADGWEVAFWPE